MMNKKNFVNSVWEKYDSYLNNGISDSFFQKNITEKVNYTIKFQAMLSLFLVILSCVGMVYAGNYIYEEIIQKASQKNSTGAHVYKDEYEDMILEDGRYYKKISNYDDYLTAREKWGNIVSMTREDFLNNFVVVIVLERFEDSATYVSTVGADDKTLYIELKKYQENECVNINNNVLSVKINNNLNRDKIEINRIIELKPTSNLYTNLEKLPADYSLEQALEDNCFVVSGMDIKSKNKEQLDEFVKKTENNENCFIRVVVSIDNKTLGKGLIIKDIEYRDGKYLICVDETRFKGIGQNYFNDEEIRRFYNIGSKIMVGDKESNIPGEMYYTYELERIKESNDPNTYDTINICTFKK